MATADATYDVVVLGSSLAGLSATIAAARRGQKVLLVEAGTIAGYDFVETLQLHRGWQLPAGAGELAAELHQAATARKIIAGDRCDTAAFSCLLQDFLAQTPAKALYMTDVLRVQAPAAGHTGFVITISNRSGIATVQADRLIDATLEAVSLRAQDVGLTEQPAANWAFRGLLVGVDLPADVQNNALPATGSADLTVAPGCYANDVIVELHGMSAPPDIGAARVNLLNRIATLRQQAAWKPYTVGTLANLAVATPRIAAPAAALDRLEAAGWIAPAAWRNPALAGAPWTAVQAGCAAAAGQLAAAK